MKSLKSLSILAVFIISAFLLTSSKCKKKDCVGPTIVFDPSAESITKSLAVNNKAAEVYTVNVVVKDEEDDIASIVVSKSLNGAVVNASFINLTGVGSKNKTVPIVDSIKGVDNGDVITYIIVATSSCKDAVSTTKTLTVTVVPSAEVLDVLLYLVENAQQPWVYSRFSIDAAHPSAWDLQNRLAKFSGNPNADKDLRDSSKGATGATPFAGVTRWGSRNGTKFVKAPSTFDWAHASPKLIIDAYNAGTSTDFNLVEYSANDYIIVKIKDGKKYAVVKIRSIIDDGALGEDYTLFSYILAQ